MKIGFNARFLVHPYTGIGMYTRQLVKALATIHPQDQFLLFTPERVDFDLPTNCDQVRVQESSMRSDSLRKAHFEHVLLPAAMQAHHIDLAHFLYPSNPRKKMPFRVVTTVHDVIPWVLKPYRKRLRSKLYHAYVKAALKYADHVLTVSNFSQQEILEYLPVSKKNITVTPLGPPNETSQSFKGAPKRRPFLLYVGGYDPRKNVPMLMEAFQKHVANRHPIDLMLVGAEGLGLEQYYTDKHFNKVDKKYVVKPKGSIIATPFLSERDLATLYHQATGFVHMSTYEGFNLSLLAAMQSGLPMLISDLPVHHEVVDDAALFVDPTDVDAIGHHILELITQKSLQRSLKKQGQERVQWFSWERCADQTYSIYKRILNN